MMNPTSNPKLERLYHFFKTHGTERLNGLDESYFFDLHQSEKEEAWNFLRNGVPSSYEHIKGLYALHPDRALQVFKAAIGIPMEISSYESEREQLESSRLLMLSYITAIEPEEEYINAMVDFSNSEFPDIRGQFAQFAPAHKTTFEATEALKKMIFTETEISPRASAITKLMALHGMKFKLKDPIYDSIYLMLRSDDPKDKQRAMKQLETHQQPDYLEKTP